MALEVYKGEMGASKSYENEFFRTFAYGLKRAFDKRGVDGVLYGFPKCMVDEKLQIDSLLSVGDRLVLIDFKSYEGTLEIPDAGNFREGAWMLTSPSGERVEVKGGASCPNPYRQLIRQSGRLRKLLIEKGGLEGYDASQLKAKSSYIVCFQHRVRLASQVPRAYSHLKVANRDNYIETILDCIDVEQGRMTLVDCGVRDSIGAIFEFKPYNLETDTLPYSSDLKWLEEICACISNDPGSDVYPALFGHGGKTRSDFFFEEEGLLGIARKALDRKETPEKLTIEISEENGNPCQTYDESKKAIEYLAGLLPPLSKNKAQKVEDGWRNFQSLTGQRERSACWKSQDAEEYGGYLISINRALPKKKGVENGDLTQEEYDSSVKEFFAFALYGAIVGPRAAANYARVRIDGDPDGLTKTSSLPSEKRSNRPLPGFAVELGVMASGQSKRPSFVFYKRVDLGSEVELHVGRPVDRASCLRSPEEALPETVVSDDRFRLTIPYAPVSRNHLAVMAQGEGVLVADQGSSHGAALLRANGDIVPLRECSIDGSPEMAEVERGDLVILCWDGAGSIPNGAVALRILRPGENYDFGQSAFDGRDEEAGGGKESEGCVSTRAGGLRDKLLRALYSKSLFEFGNWKGEPLMWHVLDPSHGAEPRTFWLVSRDIVEANIIYSGDGSPWKGADSDVCKFLKGPFSRKAFTDDQRRAMAREGVFLPSANDAEILEKEHSFHLKADSSPRLRSELSSAVEWLPEWWLLLSESNDRVVSYVDEEGEVRSQVLSTDMLGKLGIRPSVLIDLKKAD